MFLTARGKPIHPSNFYRRVWRPALEAAGLGDSGYRMHDGRHTFRSRLGAAGVDSDLLRTVGGWADARTADRYSHVDNNRVSELATRLGD